MILGTGLASATSVAPVVAKQAPPVLMRLAAAEATRMLREVSLAEVLA